MASPYNTSPTPLRWPTQAMVRLLELKAHARLVRELDGPRSPQFVRALLALDIELHAAYHLLHRQSPRTDRSSAEAYGMLTVHLASVSSWLKLQV